MRSSTGFENTSATNWCGTMRSGYGGVLEESVPIKLLLVQTVYPGAGSEEVERQVSKPIEDALKDAMDSAEEGDLILFSPAFASFSMFNNEFDRGDQFVELVKKL